MTLRIGLPSDAQGLKILGEDGIWTPATGTPALTNLVTNPSFESVQPGSTVLRTNYARDPSASISANNFVNIGGNVAPGTRELATDNPKSGNLSWRITIHGSGQVGNKALVPTSSLMIRKGETFVWSYWIYSTRAGVVYPYWEGSKVIDGSYTGGGGGSAAPIPANTWTKITGKYTAVLDAYVAGAGGYNLQVEAGDVVWTDEFLIERGDTLGEFFYGDTLDALGWDYAWAGDPGTSVSVAKASAVEVRKNLTTNPGFETASGLIEVRRNLSTDPATASGLNVGVNKLGWRTSRWFGPSGGTGAYTWETGKSDGPLGISTYLRKTWTATPTSNGDTGFDNTQGGTAGWPVSVGTTYSFSSYIRASASGKGGARIRVYWADTAGTRFSNVSGPLLTLNVGEWTRLEFTATAPETAVYAIVYSDVTDGTLWQPGDTLDGTALQVEISPTVSPYFDGSTPASGDFTYAWVGTAHASESVQRGEQVSGVISSNNGANLARHIKSKEWSASGGSSVRIIPIGTSIDTGINAFGSPNPGGMVGFVAGKTYTAMATVRLSTPLTGTIHARSLGILVANNADGWSNSVTTKAPNVAGAHNLRLTFTIPSTATWAVLRLYNGSTSTDVWWDNFLLVEGTYTGPYFDGSTAPSGDFIHAWTGTENASESIQQAVVSNTTIYGTSKAYRSSENGVKALTVLNTPTHDYASFDIPKGVETYTLIMDVKTPLPYIRLVDRSASYGSPNTLYSVPTTPNEWTQVKIHRPRASAVATKTLDIGYDATYPLEQPFHLRKVAIIEGTYTGDYFDGDTPPNIDYIYRWSGSPHASTSIGA